MKTIEVFGKAALVLAEIMVVIFFAAFGVLVAGIKGWAILLIAAAIISLIFIYQEAEEWSTAIL